jgi:putative hemolysin
MHAEIAYRLAGVAVLMLLSAFLSGSETALFSLTRVQLERMRQSSRTSDRIITGLLALPRRLITTILIGNELCNISIATLVAALVEHLLRGVLGPVHLALVSTIIALPVLVLLCDITPKSVALRVAEPWARAAARPIGLLGRLVAPLRWVIGGIANAVLFLLGQRSPGPGARHLQEAEFRALVDAGSQQGEVEAAERRLIHNVFEFGDRTVGEIMTPMERMFTLPYDWSLARILEAVQQSRYSRVPIYRRAKDNIVGILLAKDLVVMARGHSPTRSLGELLLPAYYVPKGTKCDFLFRQMQRRKTHMAIVVNEYGRTIGLCTMEDLLEELFGEIADEKEAPLKRGRDAGAAGEGAAEPAAATTPAGEPPGGRP